MVYIQDFIFVFQFFNFYCIYIPQANILSFNLFNKIQLIRGICINFYSYLSSSKNCHFRKTFQYIYCIIIQLSIFGIIYFSKVIFMGIIWKLIKNYMEKLMLGNSINFCTGSSKIGTKNAYIFTNFSIQFWFFGGIYLKVSYIYCLCNSFKSYLM
jgi:hypothetical protein